MSFKDMLANDLDNIFMNTEELADMKYVEGEIIPVIEDNERLTELKTRSQFAGQITRADKLIFIKLADLGYVPAIDSTFDYGEDTYRVNLVTESGGMLEIVLESYS